MFKHLHSTATCFDSYNYLFFKIIDKANFKLDLKINKALHINLRKPNVNTQQNHLSLTLSLQLPATLFFFVCAFLFHLLLSLSLTLIMDFFYCLNYTLLLRYLISTHLLSHLSLSSIIFSISPLIISIFYCLNYMSLLLHPLLWETLPVACSYTFFQN